MRPQAEWLRETLRLVHLSAKLMASRRFWVVPLLVLVWPAYHVLSFVLGWNPNEFAPAAAQGLLIGFPLTVLAVGLGVRVIAGDIDRRTLEIGYTVPGGPHRIWLAKLAAAMLMLLAAELLLALATFVFFTGFPPGALYGAMQAATFYLILSMSMSTLFKSEATGALVTVVLLVANGVVSGFGGLQLRFSPFWNPEALQAEPADVLAWTVQNRIGFVLAIAVVAALTFARAERREKLLGG